MTDGYKVKKRGKIPLYYRKDYITEVENGENKNRSGSGQGARAGKV